MRNVGFPRGLRITEEDILRQLERAHDRELDSLLLVELTESGELIGEAKLGSPDNHNVASTDIKLLPEYWGNGYGTEIKRALIDYIFRHTDAVAIQATPNKSNQASQRMQEAVGAEIVGEGVYRFPEEMRELTEDVAYIEYRVTRETWPRSQG